MAGRIFREPAFEHTLLLLEHLSYSPKTRECKTSYYGRQCLVLYQQGQGAAYKANHKPYPPAFLTPIILHLNDGRMAQTDAQKHRSAHNNSTPVHAAKIVQAERRKNKISWFLFRGAAYFQSNDPKGTVPLCHSGWHRGTVPFGSFLCGGIAAV